MYRHIQGIDPAISPTREEAEDYNFPDPGFNGGGAMRPWHTALLYLWEHCDDKDTLLFKLEIEIYILKKLLSSPHEAPSQILHDRIIKIARESKINKGYISEKALKYDEYLHTQVGGYTEPEPEPKEFNDDF